MPTTLPANGAKSTAKGVHDALSPPATRRVCSTTGSSPSATTRTSAVPLPAPQNPSATLRRASAAGRTQQRSVLGGFKTNARFGAPFSTTSPTMLLNVGAA
jgi:hypothetical protein